MPSLYPPVNGPFTKTVNKNTYTSAGQYQPVTVIIPADVHSLQEAGWLDVTVCPTPNMTTSR